MAILDCCWLDPKSDVLRLAVQILKSVSLCTCDQSIRKTAILKFRLQNFLEKKIVWNCSRGIKTIHKDKRGSYKQSMKYVKKFQYWNLYGVKGDIKETEINFNRI